MVICSALAEHREYLADDARLRAYSEAISAIVKPGDIVLDLGAGTGILGLLACRAGAGRVYSVEFTSIIGLARVNGRTNDFADRITFLRGFSTELELPEKVDVVVADQIGNFCFNTGLVRFFRDARERLLKPGGILMPSSVDLYAAPAEFPEIVKQLDFWCEPKAGFDLSAARAIAANTGHFTKLRADQVLGAPVKLASLDLYAPLAREGTLSANLSFTVNRSGTLHGIGTWFSAQLAPGVHVTNSPLAADAMRRGHLVFPIAQPVALSEGDQVEARVRILDEESVVSWRVEVPGKASFNHSTWNGMLLSQEDLGRSRPEFVPSLSPMGNARLLALTLCDGRRPLCEIEQEVFRSYPALFHSLREAAGFVAEVVARYSG